MTPHITPELINGLAEVQAEALLANLKLSQGYSWKKGEGVLLAWEGESWEPTFPERGEEETEAVPLDV